MPTTPYSPPFSVKLLPLLSNPTHHLQTFPPAIRNLFHPPMGLRQMFSPVTIILFHPPTPLSLDQTYQSHLHCTLIPSQTMKRSDDDDDDKVSVMPYGLSHIGMLLHPRQVQLYLIQALMEQLFKHPASFGWISIHQQHLDLLLADLSNQLSQILQEHLRADLLNQLSRILQQRLRADLLNQLSRKVRLLTLRK
jgi:hypothetical protein